MKTIYKYTLKVTDEQTISMPYNSEILSVQVQNGAPCLWAMVDTTFQNVDKVIKIHGTGNPIPKSDSIETFIGTFQLGGFVGHVFQNI